MMAGEVAQKPREGAALPSSVLFTLIIGWLTIASDLSTCTHMHMHTPPHTIKSNKKLIFFGEGKDLFCFTHPGTLHELHMARSNP